MSDILGFIGLGIMGESMCERLVSARHEVHVFDINPAQVGKLVAIGALPCASVAEVAARADVIFVMVPNSEHVAAVINDALPALKPGTVIVDMSTISPAVSRELAASVAARGGILIDAPVVKSKAAAIEGKLGIYVGGDTTTFDRVLPFLKCMGENVIHLGPNGAGLVMKLCHNAMVAGIQAAVNEMLVLAAAAGIDVPTFARCMSYGGGQNFYLDAKAASIAARDFSPKFPFEHMNKDLDLAGKLAADLGLDLPGLRRAATIYAAGMATGLSREDFSAALKVVEDEARQEPDPAT